MSCLCVAANTKPDLSAWLTEISYLCTSFSLSHTCLAPVAGGVWRGIINIATGLLSSAGCICFFFNYYVQLSSLAEPSLELVVERGRHCPPVPAGLINAISLHLLLLNFYFNWGHLKQNHPSRGVNQVLIAGLGYFDCSRYSLWHTKARIIWTE